MDLGWDGVFEVSGCFWDEKGVKLAPCDGETEFVTFGGIVFVPVAVKFRGRSCCKCHFLHYFSMNTFSCTFGFDTFHASLGARRLVANLLISSFIE